jgi:hypothetical protein
VFLVTLYTETQWFLLNITRTLLFQEQQYQGMKQIFSKTLWLMKLLARENKEVQEKLFHHLDTLYIYDQICTPTTHIYDQILK